MPDPPKSKKEKANVFRGEVWMADLSPVVGHEQKGYRPVLVISVDEMNESPGDLVIVLPMTSRRRGFPSHIQVGPDSYVMCDQVRTISKNRLIRQHVRGIVEADSLYEIEEILRSLMGL